MKKYVTYMRVSTAEQGKSGLGLEAQKRDIAIFLETYSEVPFEIIGEFIDVLSGTDDDRPELDLSRNCAAPLIAYHALKEKRHGITTDSRI